MATELAQNSYGKSAVRLATVQRGAEAHEFRDVTIGVQLEGDFHAAYVEGDNRDVLPTDTMRATVYALAKEQPIGDIEDFGLRLGRHFLGAAPATGRARVRLVEQPWERASVDGAAHPHTFEAAGGGQRAATVAVSRTGEPEVWSGITGWRILKTTGSGFAGFLRDDLTTLEDAADRLLATTVNADWQYEHLEVDFGKVVADVRQAMLEVFATTYSPSVQHTLHTMGQAALVARPEIAEISLSLPNQHHILVDVGTGGLDVFLPSDQPFGLIEGTVTRR